MTNPDQTKDFQTGRHFLAIDDSCYDDDPDMQYLIERLKNAASDPKILQAMRMEDAYWQAMKERERASTNPDKQVTEQENRITE